LDLPEKAEPHNREDIYSRRASVNILSPAQMLSLPRARHLCGERGPVPHASNRAVAYGRGCGDAGCEKNWSV